MSKTTADVLPGWAARRADGVIVVDPAVAYPTLLHELGVLTEDLDQYWVEVAYQCTKMEIQRCLGGTEFDPRASGLPLAIKILNRPEWALKRFALGRGVNAATNGREARAHYIRLRGAVPQ